MGRLVHWQSILEAGDQLTLTFDPEDYEEKEILAGDANLVQALYEDEHLIIVNKPEGMKRTPINQMKSPSSTTSPLMSGRPVM